jgi:fructose-1,6-bisphosphatase/inositol monophosphatase family enzyme
MHFLSPERRAELEARSAGKLSVVPIPRCAAEQYPRLALGQNDISLFERSLPWDHAPGALFLEEAGGIIRRTDGSPYRVGDGGKGLLGASSRRMWDAAAEILLK